MSDPDSGAAPEVTTMMPTIFLGVKFYLLVDRELVQYCNTVERELTAANLQWIHMTKNFDIQGKFLKARKDEKIPELPKIAKLLPIILWMEAS